MTAVKIPQEYYCGRKKVDGLGFITPDGDDAAAKKRKATVQSWTKGYYHQSPNTVRELDNPDFFFSFKNTPTQGFIIKHSVTRYHTSNKLFRVYDPRGFEIEISAENLAAICLQGGVTHGHLDGTYVYGREGKDNVLLPTGSPIFKEAFELTKDVMAGKLSLRELKIGQKVMVLHQNKRVECLYVGRRWHVHTPWAHFQDCLASDLNAEQTTRYHGLYGRGSHTTWHRRVYKDVIEKPRHMFLLIKGADNNYGPLLNPSSPHVLKILEQDFMSEEATEVALATYNGDVIKPHEPSQWHKRDGYRMKPDSISLYALTKAEAEEAVANRKDYLENFVQTGVAAEKKR